MAEKRGLVLEGVIFDDVHASNEKSWSERDALPEGDPIGDVDESWKKDMKAYFDTMRDKVIKVEGKDFRYGYNKYGTDENILIPCDGRKLDSSQYEVLYGALTVEEPKCDCGTFKVYGKVPTDAHMKNCQYRKWKESI